MRKELKNYAFIDLQNLYFGVKEAGWKMDYKRFRVYLREKYGVAKAYVFTGFMPTNHKLYSFLRAVGFTLVFKPILELKDGSIKGNCDAELVLHAMIEHENYDKAILVTGDGDFHCLVEYLQLKNKFGKLLAPSKKYCSFLLKKLTKKKIVYLSLLKKKLAYKKSYS